MENVSYSNIEADSWPSNRSSLCFTNDSIAGKTLVTPLPKRSSWAAWKIPAGRECIPSPSRSPINATWLYVRKVKYVGYWKCHYSTSRADILLSKLARKVRLGHNIVQNYLYSPSRYTIILTDISLHMIPISCTT